MSIQNNLLLSSEDNATPKRLFHRSPKALLFFFAAGLCMLIAPAVQAQKHMERLNRGVVAVRSSASQVFVSWRMFGTDPASIAFNVYRGSTKLNASPITNSTNYVDNTSTNSTYTVRPVINGTEQAASESASVWGQQYLTIPLQRPAGGSNASGSYTYNANDCSVGDLDGDGEYEIILKWDPSNSKDNSQSGYTGNVYLDAYKLNGTRLWRIDLGINIRAGAHYTQFMVYDLDSDGKAEVACKTADGTRDGRGTVIGSASADHRNSGGYILTGPEYLTVFNGQTGAAMATVNYEPGRGTVSSWGDGYGNRVDRFVAGVAYLDGQRPSLVMGRGYYTRLVRVAYDWRNGQLTRRWIFDSNSSGNSAYAGQGNHQNTVGDVDGDGRDEFINGSSAINDNGTGQWVNRLGHGDALHMSDMNPDRAGQEIWQPYEGPSGNGGTGLALIDARTGGTIWRVPVASGDIGRAMAADIDPRYKGYELWGATGGLYTVTGTQITTTRPSMNFGIWWDGDLQRELLDGTKLDKWNSSNNTVGRLYTFYNFGTATDINGTKANPNLSGDIIGDWREEAIYRSSDNTQLLLFTTTIPTTNRIYTLMHDPQYRLAIAWQNVAYNQPPHPSFYLGGGMAPPPTPNIVLVGGTTTPPTGSSTTIQENTTGFCSLEGTIDNNNAGFSGTGFANATNAVGAGINWKVNATAAGSYTLAWNQSNGGTVDRPARVLVNGAAVVATLSFPSTSLWTTWSEVSATVTLRAGVNDIRLEATTANGLSNIDYLKVTGTTPSAASCSATARLGTEESLALSVAPNPSTHTFLIKAKGKFNFQVLDQIGREVEVGSGEEEATAGAALKPGLYVIRVYTPNGIQSVKLIKN